jgi:hypothetical protein
MLVFEHVSTGTRKRQSRWPTAKLSVDTRSPGWACPLFFVHTTTRNPVRSSDGRCCDSRTVCPCLLGCNAGMGALDHFLATLLSSAMIARRLS